MLPVSLVFHTIVEIDLKNVFWTNTPFYYYIRYPSKQSSIPPLIHQYSKSLSTFQLTLETLQAHIQYWMLSFNELHEMAGRATPMQLRDYKISLQLYKTMDVQLAETDWINLNLNAVITSRQTKFITNKANRVRVGMNAFSNRAWHINGKINLDWLNLSYNSYKVKCKKLFLSWVFCNQFHCQVIWLANNYWSSFKF